MSDSPGLVEVLLLLCYGGCMMEIALERAKVGDVEDYYRIDYTYSSSNETTKL